MNIKFSISKKYNHFFFVQTLADWHFSCRAQYIEDWLKLTGPLTDKEKSALEEFKSVISKYGFDPIKKCPAANAFDFFMRFDGFKKQSPFSKQEINIYLNAMKILEKKFNRIWEEEGSKLEKVEKLLSEKFDQSKNEVCSDLRSLFENYVDLKKDIEVILLLSTGEGIGGGGANNGPDKITLECSSTDSADINYLLSTLWHEISHLIMDNYFEETSSLMDKGDTIKEASVEAKKIDFNYSKELVSFSIFSPMSYFTGKHFSTDIAEKLNDSVAKKDIKWLLEQKYVFILYLIYLNGLSIQKKIDSKQSISPRDMSGAIIANHKEVRDFFLENNKKPIWFEY